MSTAPYIRTGNMRQYAELQRRSDDPDGGGGSTTTWETERMVWVQIRPLSGSRRLEGMQRESQVTHDIYARHQSDIAPDVAVKKRIQYEQETYDIRAAWNPQSQPEFVHMLAVRGVAT